MHVYQKLMSLTKVSIKPALDGRYVTDDSQLTRFSELALDRDPDVMSIHRRGIVRHHVGSHPVSGSFLTQEQINAAKPMLWHGCHMLIPK